MMSISSADQIEILRVVRRVAGTNINRGRAFFTCSINKDEVGYCGYFIWVDQLIEALGVDDSLGTFSMEQRRQFGREEDKTMWKAQVNSKLDYVSRRPPNWIPPPPDEDVTPLMISCPMPRCQLVMMTFMQTPRLPPSGHGQNQG
ncbi:hypothetical protein JHK84_044479 [Glycine max]|nr:hypothetical protein JHK86_044367 [Glycine max]KAG5107572.1 hypothetical protein JHK84_044479 [Glycine max]